MYANVVGAAIEMVEISSPFWYGLNMGARDFNEFCLNGQTHAVDYRAAHVCVPCMFTQDRRERIMSMCGYGIRSTQ